MKTHSKLSLYLLAVAIIAASCKGKPGSGASSGVADVPTAKGASVIDSLQITDPDEKKVCALYDNAVSEYIKDVNIALADTNKLHTFQDSAVNKKFEEASEKLKPEMENLKNTLKTNPAELMKFEQFSLYEAQRLMPMMSKFGNFKMPTK